ncbi:MAG: acyltransferase domain-containing protein [Victivallales bacterium]|nr:acyltransferase domain-containing protein [Victivallales bacterium]
MFESFSDNKSFLAEYQRHAAAFAADPTPVAAALTPEFIREQTAFARCGESETAVLLRIAATIAAQPELQELFAFAVYHLQHSPADATYGDWPDLHRQLGPEGSCLYLLAALTLIPGIRRTYCDLGVDDAITRDTTLEFSGFCRNHLQGCGVPGIFREQLYWLKLYRDGRLFRLGRMEYKAEKFASYGVVLRHRRTAATVMLAPDGNRYAADGLALPPETAAAVGWTAVYRETPTTFTGHPIRPEGRTEPTPVTLRRDDWDIMLRPGDDIIDTHIPPGGGLSPAVCRDSLQQAAQFFPRLRPECHFRAFFCLSWIFNTQLEERLPETNLARFMREPYLFPVPGSRFAGMFFVFSRPGITAATLPELPRTTRLQRVMLDILAAGDDLRYGAMFYLLPDLPHFGTQYYRRHYRQPE